MSRRMAKEFQAESSPTRRALAGAIRRMAVKLTTKVLWQLVGHRTDDGHETLDIEVFPGIGFYARPRATDRAEAIVAHVGGADSPVVVATRNEKVRATIASLAENETAMFNDAAIVYITASGQVHVRSKNGTAVALLTVAEHNNHTHPTAGNGPPSTPTTPATGTTVLKGE